MLERYNEGDLRDFQTVFMTRMVENITVLGITGGEPVLLLSVFKQVVMFAVFAGWAWQVSRTDEDLSRLAVLPRRYWNGIQMVVGIAAFSLWLIIPWFWLGLPVALVGTVGPLLGYTWYRNERVPESARWSLPWESLGQPGKWQQVEAIGVTSQLTMLNPDMDDPLPLPSTMVEIKAHQALEGLLRYVLQHAAERFEITTDDRHTKVLVWIDGLAYPQSGFGAAACGRADRLPQAPRWTRRHGSTSATVGFIADRIERLR